MLRDLIEPNGETDHDEPAPVVNVTKAEEKEEDVGGDERTTAPCHIAKNSIDLLRDIIGTLFPQVSRESNLPTVQTDPGEIPEVTTKEVLEAATKIAENKATGLNGIPNKEGTDSGRRNSSKVVRGNIYYVPEEWRKQKLVLIPKSSKPLSDRSF
ncbi:unnamed protein product [Hermetia illucens]|uniref:Uncharacterized protein n=1 Tax=Hermetia illucens TaxID=343691 RepID=A0A7R8UZF2_HERIL|nr:unnamed protein product [Hermetia illucens]